jgi:hypothetical protein
MHVADEAQVAEGHAAGRGSQRSQLHHTLTNSQIAEGGLSALE